MMLSKEQMAMLKAIHAQEDRQAAEAKAADVIWTSALKRDPPLPRDRR